jgi:hypothetical protein
MRNPFEVDVCGTKAESVDVGSRLYAVKSFSKNDCRAALKLPDLQKTVRMAIERRLKRMLES